MRITTGFSKQFFIFFTRLLAATLLFGFAQSCSRYGGFESILGLDVGSNALPSGPTTLTVNGLVLEQSGGSTSATEGGATDDLSFRLSSEPAASVTVTLSTSGSRILMNGAPAPIALTFSPTCPSATCWSNPQTVTLSAVDNLNVDGDVTETISTSMTSTDPDFNALSGPSVSIRVYDNDVAPVIQTSASSITLSEGGASGSVSVTLSVPPAAPATVNVAFDPAIVRVNGSATSPVALNFTSANYSTPQTLTVLAFDDAVAEGTHTSSLSLSSLITTTKTIGISVSDNETKGITQVLPGGGLTASEAGGTSAYTIRLNSEPTGTVTVKLNFTDTQIKLNGSGSPLSLTFTTTNWNTPQTVTVSAVDDSDLEGAHNAAISYTITGADYEGLSATSATVALTDNDTAALTITESGGSTSVVEGGATDSYTVKLASRPTANVTVSIAFSGSQVKVNGSTSTPQTLTFTTANWNTDQTVTITAVDDASAEGSHSAVLAHTASGGGYTSAPTLNVTAAITDNDSPGLVVVQTGSPAATAVSEGGSADTYTVKLSSPPSGNVSVSLSFNTADLKLNTSSTSPLVLTFTTANWNTAQTVSVTANSDLLKQGDRTSNIDHTVSSGVDALYNALGLVTGARVGVAVTDTTTQQNAWWNTAYTRRLKIVFGTSHAALTTEHTASVTLSTTDTTRFTITTGDDARVVWQPASGTTTELDRRVFDWQTAASRIDFKIQSAVAANANEAADGSYYLYYRNTAATTAPHDEMQVYFFADFFDRADTSTIERAAGDWLEWDACTSGGAYTCAADAYIENGVLRISGSPTNDSSNTSHYRLERGILRQLPSALSVPFRAEVDWVLQPVYGGSFWEETNWQYGIQFGNFPTDIATLRIMEPTEHNAGLIYGEGNEQKPYSWTASDGTVYNMQSKMDMTAGATGHYRRQNAPGFVFTGDPTANLYRATSALTAAAAERRLRYRMDIRPVSNTWDVYLNGASEATNIPFLGATTGSITNLRLFVNTYRNAATQPAQGFDNLRVYIPATATTSSEESYP